MLPEFLLIYGCLSSHCQELMIAYQNYNPEIYKKAKNIEDRTLKYLGKDAVFYLTPIYYLGVKKEIIFPMGLKNLNIKANEEKIMLIYSQAF
jgi:hypothetical protein